MLNQADVIVIVIVQLLTAAFVYGRLTEKVRGHGEDIRDVKATQKENQDALTRHEGELGELFGHAGLTRH